MNITKPQKEKESSVDGLMQPPCNGIDQRKCMHAKRLRTRTVDVKVNLSESYGETMLKNSMS